MLNVLFNMKKATVRDIVHGFAKLNQSLQPGETVEITAHGKVIGHYTKATRRRIKLPDFYKACQFGYGPTVGYRLAKPILAEDETIS